MSINQGFSYTGSSEYIFSNVAIQDNGIALFDSLTGIGGIDYMPADGDTVTVIAGFDTSAKTDVRQFDPGMNNNAYYLVTDTDYTANDRDIILSLATPVTMTYNLITKRYEGTFVFSNPDELPNLYLIWDYTDNLNTGTIGYSGKRTERTVNIDFGSNRGICGVDYATINRPVRYKLIWNNVLVADSGYVGLNSITNYNALIAAGVDPNDIKLVYPYDSLVDNGTGQFRFNKFSSVSEAYLLISAIRDSSSFSVTRVDPSLTSFYMDPTPSDLSTVCSLTPNVEYFHDGIGSIPVIGDRVYLDVDGINLIDGANSYFQTSSTSLPSPPLSGGTWVAIGTDGIVYDEGGCDCAEIAEPTITAQGFVFTTNQNVNVQIEATNNPTSWEIITTCEEYTLSGGTTGTIFTYDDCKYGSQTVTVNINDTKVICSDTAPVIVGGDGSSTLNGACLSSVLPRGLSFDTNSGIISGTVSDECDFSFDVEATNCFGTSTTETITISIVASSKFKPFLMDVENFGTDGTAACALTAPLYSVLYHNGVNDVPTTGDLILRVYDAAGNATPFFGGGMWYRVYNSGDVIKICETGKVCDVFTCV